MASNALREDNIAQHLREAVLAGDIGAVEVLMHQFGDSRYDVMFDEIGKLARETHDTISQLASDDSLVALANVDMPDARDRLNYVVTKTEDAADRTLTVCEELMPETEKLATEAKDLAGVVAMTVTDTELRERLSEFFKQVYVQSEKNHRGLTEVLMAQEYQDLTGQVIKRTITIVDQVEKKLVHLLHACNKMNPTAPAPAVVNGSNTDEASSGPSIRVTADVVAEQADVDELLSDLGF